MVLTASQPGLLSSSGLGTGDHSSPSFRHCQQPASLQQSPGVSRCQQQTSPLWSLDPLSLTSSHQHQEWHFTCYIKGFIFFWSDRDPTSRRKKFREPPLSAGHYCGHHYATSLLPHNKVVAHSALRGKKWSNILVEIFFKMFGPRGRGGSLCIFYPWWVSQWQRADVKTVRTLYPQ